METTKRIIKKLKAGFLKEMGGELRWIYHLASAYKKGILCYTILMLITVLISLSISVRSKDLVDLLVEQNWKGVFEIAVYYIGIGTLNVGISMTIQRMSAVLNNQVKKDSTIRVFKKILRADWENLIEHHSGDLMTRINEDIHTISSSIVGWIPLLLSQGIQMLLSLGIIIYYDVSMLGVIIVAAPLVLIGSRIFLKKVYEENKNQREVASELMTFDKETFQNIQSIKAFDLASIFEEKMKELQKKRQTVELRVNQYSIASWAVMYMSGQIAALICLGWAMYHVYTGVLTLGTMALMVILASSISGSFKSLIDLIPGIMGTMASSARIRNLLDLPEENADGEEQSQELAKRGKREGMSIYVKQVAFSYKNGRKVLEQVNLFVLPGEIVALIGPSGEGKTTMLRLLTGVIRSQAGEISIGLGKEHADKVPMGSATRKMIAYVPQGNTIMSGTIAENMRLLRANATDEEIIKALKQACAYEFVEKLPDGIYYKIGEGGIGFSEGQNQRLSIARALLCDAPILLLDEATSALDVATERKILHNLMQRDRKRACILSTHRPSVLSMCDRVYRIAKTQIEQVHPEEIGRLMNEF